MQPIRTERSNFIFRSQTPEVPDMPGERIDPNHIRSIWELTQLERDAITDGLNIELDIFNEPIPPVSLNVTHEGSTLLGRRAVLIVDRFMTPDGLWYVRLLTESGAELGVSRAYKHRWSAWVGQRRLKRTFPAFEILPS